MALDIPGKLGVKLEQAAAKVHAKLLVIVSPEDHMVNPEPAIQFAAAVHAPVVKLDSPCGHLSPRSEEHTSELQSRLHLVCRLLLEKKKNSLVYLSSCVSKHTDLSTS